MQKNISSSCEPPQGGTFNQEVLTFRQYSYNSIAHIQIFPMVPIMSFGTFFLNVAFGG